MSPSARSRVWCFSLVSSKDWLHWTLQISNVGGKKVKCWMRTQILCIPHNAAIPHPIMVQPFSQRHVESRQTIGGWLPGVCWSCCGSVWPFHVWCSYCNQIAKLQPQPTRDLGTYGIGDLWDALATPRSFSCSTDPDATGTPLQKSEPQHSQPKAALLSPPAPTMGLLHHPSSQHGSDTPSATQTVKFLQNILHEYHNFYG